MSGANFNDTDRQAYRVGGTDVAVTDGGTGASSASAALTALGAMAKSANLSDVASVATAIANLGLPGLVISKVNVDLATAATTALYTPAGGLKFIPFLVIGGNVNINSFVGPQAVITLGGFLGATTVGFTSLFQTQLFYPTTVVGSEFNNGSPFNLTVTVAAGVGAGFLTADFYTIGIQY